MKKLLVLVLVLGMAVAANSAVIQLAGDNNPGAGDVTVTVTDIGEWLDGFMVVTIQGVGTLTSSLGDSAPTDAEWVCLMSDVGLAETYGEGDIWTMISYTNTYPVGVWIDASYTGAVAGDILTARVSLDGENWTDVGQIIIPEPATIALLCLGGLLLRKKA